VSIRSWLLASLLGAALCSPACATSAYEYAEGEDVVIDGGMAPSLQRSLASRGEGSSGSDNFHIYLMAEPAHRRITALRSITSKDILDSGPKAFHASWAPDSRHAAVAFRVDRHVLISRLFRIERHHAVEIAGPSLFKDVTGRDVGYRNDDERTSVPTIAWLGPRRFVVTENRLFRVSSPNLLRSLGRFGRPADDAGDKRTFVKFSAAAVCQLVHGNRYRIVDLKPGRFDD
jgi:hypothetical protein